MHQLRSRDLAFNHRSVIVYKLHGVRTWFVLGNCWCHDIVALHGVRCGDLPAEHGRVILNAVLELSGGHVFGLVCRGCCVYRLSLWNLIAHHRGIIVKQLLLVRCWDVHGVIGGSFMHKLSYRHV